MSQPVEEKILHKFKIPIDSKGNIREGCCSEYFEICGGCDGKPIEIKSCKYDVNDISITPIFYGCKLERECQYPPAHNSNVSITSTEKVCSCDDTVGWTFFIYPPPSAQVLLVSTELVPHKERSKPCKGGHKKGGCKCNKDK